MPPWRPAIKPCGTQVARAKAFSGSLLLASALLAISSAGLVRSGQPIRALADPDGACSPLVHVGGGSETCYLPGQKEQAEARFPLPPVDPSPAVQRLTGLPLVQIVRYRQTTQPRTTRFLLYIYGTLPPIGDRALYGSAPFPPPRAHPRYMIVQEELGHLPGLQGLFLGRPVQFGPDGKTAVAYGAWHLDANFPHRDLQLMIVSDATKAVTRTLGKAIIAIDGAGPGVPSPFVRLSLSVPAASYPREALVRVTVRLQNVWSHPIHLLPLACGTGNPSVNVLDAAGRIVYPPILPGGPIPSCPMPVGPGEAMAPGHVLTTRTLVVMRGWRLQAEANTVEAGTILGTPVWIKLTAPDAPRVTIGTQPALHADLTRPAGASGPLWYVAWSGCRNGIGQGQSVVGTLAWRSIGGARLAASLPEGCASAPQWHALAGWLGHSVAHIDHAGEFRVSP